MIPWSYDLGMRISGTAFIGNLNERRSTAYSLFGWGALISNCKENAQEGTRRAYGRYGKLCAERGGATDL